GGSGKKHFSFSGRLLVVFPVFSSVLSVEGLSGSGRRHLAVV
ncbi:MAG: hypothetical protein AVDCRST_MAG28-2356, partial [uncultured Rubrobacteraceae bacterium]